MATRSGRGPPPPRAALAAAAALLLLSSVLASSRRSTAPPAVASALAPPPTLASSPASSSAARHRATARRSGGGSMPPPRMSLLDDVTAAGTSALMTVGRATLSVADGASTLASRTAGAAVDLASSVAQSADMAASTSPLGGGYEAGKVRLYLWGNALGARIPGAGSLPETSAAAGGRPTPPAAAAGGAGAALNGARTSAAAFAVSLMDAMDGSIASNPVVGLAYETMKVKMYLMEVAMGAQLQSAFGFLGNGVGSGAGEALTTAAGIGLSAAAAYWAAGVVLNFGDDPPAPDRPYPLDRYDPIAARAYFSQKPLWVAGRAAQVAALSAGFGLGLLVDKIRNKTTANAPRRASELASLLTRLGPAYVGAGLSLSVRTDVVPPAYERALSALRDDWTAAAPFPESEARRIIEEELGRPVDDTFTEFGSEPVAVSRLGQVYRARLRSGREVAVKVQRPGVAEGTALDVHLLRSAAPFLKSALGLDTDLAAAVDLWGEGLVDELDYIGEALNAERFTESMGNTPLGGVVFAPTAVEECTTCRVLTTEWVEGERLDDSSGEDITVLCGIAMNAYLTMTLETGALHCDPRPGNLLRTEDGRLCVLGWGTVADIDPDVQVTLIEHVAHLVSGDYDEIPGDLLRLGFVPQSKADLIEDSGIVDALADVYGTLTKGGGAHGAKVDDVVAGLRDLAQEKGDLFRIPPYFAHMARAFSVLEGIGLSFDPDYSIIRACLPYVSKRLLTDGPDGTGSALDSFIFGPDKYDVTARVVDYGRVESLITGFGSYSSTASGELLGRTADRTQQAEALTDDLLDLLAAEEGTPLQDIFVEQLAKIITSVGRTAWSDLRRASGTLPLSGGGARTVLGTVVDPLGLFQTNPAFDADELDRRTVDATRDLLRLAQDRFRGPPRSPGGPHLLDVSTLTAREVIELSMMLVRKVWDRRRGVMRTFNRLAAALIEVTADKLYALPAENEDDQGRDGDGYSADVEAPAHALGYDERRGSDGLRRDIYVLGTPSERYHAAIQILSAAERGEDPFIEKGNTREPGGSGEYGGRPPPGPGPGPVPVERAGVKVIHPSQLP